MFTELSLFMSSLPIIESNCAVDTDGVDLTNFLYTMWVIFLDPGRVVSLFYDDEYRNATDYRYNVGRINLFKEVA